MTPSLPRVHGFSGWNYVPRTKTSWINKNTHAATMPPITAAPKRQQGAIKMEDRLTKLEALNKTLNPACDLSGLFLPVEAPKQFNVMFVAEMPSMNVPKGWVRGDVIPNFSETARDTFLQEMMVKYGVGGSYVTDIVKTRDYPRQPTRDEVTRWLPFLLKEIEILQPQALIVLGKRTYDASFVRLVAQHIPKNIKVDWIFHYSNQVPRKKFEERFRQVISSLQSRR